MLLPALLLLACQSEPPSPAHESALLLAWHPERLVDLQLPPTNHPGGEAAPDRTAVADRFEQVWSEAGLEQYRADLPVGQVFVGHSSRTAPAGMQLLDADGDELSYDRERTASPQRTTWRIRQGSLLVRPARGEPAPEPESLTVVYKPAADWENDLDPATSAHKRADFALRQISLDDKAYHGLLLPAPGSATWEIEVPPRGVLDFDVRILPPAVQRGHKTDGARLQVSLEHDGQRQELWHHAARVSKWRPARIDLGPWAGSTVKLTFRSDPGDSATLDRVFVANPTVYAPKEHPGRVVLVFADTVRRDHVGAYGYDRSTTPALDEWSSGAVVFDNARASASWTLPSVRSLLTSHPPGAWGGKPTLQTMFARSGYRTGAYVNNAFLTRYFDMGGGWCEYGYELLKPADEQVDEAIAFLERHDDRDAMVMVQFMDAHMPYKEPEKYRDRWAGPEPAEIEGRLHRKGLRSLRLKPDREPIVRDYLVGRYDQSIRFQDDEISRLLGAAGDDAVVVYFSDHGEEFYEHGSVEHGHTLYDELLRVPLMVSAPALEPGRVAAPVSLLDLTPTLLELAGVDGSDGFLGRSLVPLTRGDTRTQEDFAARPQFFGGLLYDDEAWGVLTASKQKWISQGSRQYVYDLEADPGEQSSLAKADESPLRAYHRAMATALDREVAPVWRLSGRGSSRVVFGFEGQIEISHPGGLLRVWHPPSLTGDMAPVVLEDGVVRVQTREDQWVPREIFVQPAGDALDPTGLQLTITRDDGESWTGTWQPGTHTLSVDDARHQRITLAGRGSSRFELSLHSAPIPWEGSGKLGDTDQVSDHLRALGYID